MSAPSLSRYNPIKHLWEPCSKWLAGVSFSACVDGESVPPAHQIISATEKEEKEKLVFEKALSDLDSYWNGNTHDGIRVISNGIIEAYGTPYKDFDEVKEMLKSSNKAIKLANRKKSYWMNESIISSTWTGDEVSSAFAKECVMIGCAIAARMQFVQSI